MRTLLRAIGYILAIMFIIMGDSNTDESINETKMKVRDSIVNIQVLSLSIILSCAPGGLASQFRPARKPLSPLPLITLSLLFPDALL